MTADPDLPQLRALLAVVDHGSFEAAARALHLTQPAVSGRIRALERAAGQVLVRRTRPTGVTEAGAVYLRLARQVATLTEQARAETAGPDTDAGPGSAAVRRPVLAVAVNSDSLSTWVLPALAAVADQVALDLRREDQDHSAALLRDGVVSAAVTTAARPVRGCTVHRLGVLRYRAVAAVARVPDWFPDGAGPAALATAPVVVFDRKDDLQDRFLREQSVDPAVPPRHHVPASADFATAVRLGLGWGMLPVPDADPGLAEGTLVDLAPGRTEDVTLHWQQWAVGGAALDRVGAALRAAAAEHLD